MKRFLLAIFWQTENRRLRSGWRLLGFFLFLFISVAVLGIALTPIFAWAARLADPAWEMLIGQLATALVITAATYAAVRWLDRRSFVSLGLRWHPGARRDLAAGVGITLLMMGGIFLAERALGWLQITGFRWQAVSGEQVVAEIVLALGFFLLVAWAEELLTRGYLLQTLADGLGMGWAVVLSSALFGLAHLGNPNATWAGAAGIFFAGLFLAYGYTRSGQLWLPIGLHLGWNFFEGVVFGFPVSGLTGFPALVETQVNGPPLWTGGPFGPEAGLIVLPALALGSWLIARLYPQATK